MRDYPTFLIIAMFIASGVSFFDGLIARFFVRITTVVVGIVAALGVALSVFFSLAFTPNWGAYLLGPDGLRITGDAMLLLYFAVCVLTCVPLLPAAQVHKLGLGLHFIVLPIATFLLTFSPLSLPLELRLGAFSHNLALGLVYAMLWFRMQEKQRPYRPLIAPVE